MTEHQAVKEYEKLIDIQTLDAKLDHIMDGIGLLMEHLNIQDELIRVLIHSPSA